MFRMLFLSVLLFAFTSCKSTKKVITETKTAIETSKITDIVKLDTTIIIPAEKVDLFIPIEKIFKEDGALKNQTLKQVQRKGRAKVTVKIDSTGITATSNCDSIAQKLNYYKTRITELTKTNIEAKTKRVEKKGFSFLEVILYLLAVAIVAFVAGYLTRSLKII
jgi:nitrate reductase NapE component